MGSEDNEKQKTYRQMGHASTIGITLVAATFVGFGAGHYLDKWIGTKPVFTIIFTIFGIIAGFREMIRIVKEVSK